MIHQVYQALKNDSQNGDFVVLSNKNREDLGIKFTYEDIICIVGENETKERTKHIILNEL